MKNISLLLIPLFLISCSESKILLKSLNKYQVPLDYLHDSKIIECDKSTNIAFGNLSNFALDSATSVTKINHTLIPLIFYNYDELNLAVNLGQSSLEQNYSSFFKQSFGIESQRTGCYTLKPDTINAEYTIEIEYDTCKIKSTYQRNSTVLFLFFAYTMSFQEIGFPAKTSLDFTLKLKKEGNLFFEKKYFIHKTQPFINTQMRDLNKLRSDFVTNMAESLSLSSKEIIEKIINDINQVIQKK
jgi:hypothetical protein